jgi:pimeloyl-ACP methyl ester carboxylesterase
MMKRIFSLLILLFFIVNGFSQTISGSWKGTLTFGQQKLAIVLHIQTDQHGKTTCLMDSPDQSVKGIPVVLDTLSKDSISLSVPQIGMTYSGRIHQQQIDGTFSQNGLTVPLVFRPGVIVRNRPQNPTPPFPYRTQEVSFTNKKAPAVLSGTLTYPIGYRKGKKVPVVLMVSGSGLQNRNEEIFDHQPFLVLADYLARHGIASLRYDDRSYGKSTGDARSATTKDFAEDAQAGIETLRKMGRFNKVGVLGHSEGASIAFMLGARKLSDFVISLAGIGVKGDTALTAQLNRITELEGVPAHETVGQYRSNAEKQNSPWLNYFINYNPSSDIRNTHCPVMAIDGSKDTQVIASLNLTAIRGLLPKNKKNLIKEYPGMNHMFQRCKTGLNNEYANIDETIDPLVLKDIVTWIRSL